MEECGVKWFYPNIGGVAYAGRQVPKFHRCKIHPMSEWERFMEKLSKLPSADPKARQLARHFFASAVECEIDKQGRMTLPQELREYAGIEKELVTVGAYEKIEVWSKEEWNSNENAAELDPSQLAESMMNYDF